ncbi:hypothetical protein [Saccharothrix coeruleofusca]|uniref:Uncharacterized protein n=1 Tax=Saccharothrix coeruleofusca TaxID=33919 RepID=A0A918AMI3_9PSEU|nr:hypothetical protein [Saccharothrix coeruleofusca]MBP2339500.1 hypothetical protein [Saccharothrix coeruleofusca]GGP57199.1 hypothetical protein GCM10010185_31970 [Saccharothrix coeruleofusca]
MPRLALMLVRCAAALLWPADRARYLEQWRADVLGAAELGLSPLGVALGAARTAFRLKKPLWPPVGVLALALRLRESRHVGAVFAVLLIAQLGGTALLFVT